MEVVQIMQRDVDADVIAVQVRAQSAAFGYVDAHLHCIVVRYVHRVRSCTSKRLARTHCCTRRSTRREGQEGR